MDSKDLEKEVIEQGKVLAAVLEGVNGLKDDIKTLGTSFSDLNLCLQTVSKTVPVHEERIQKLENRNGIITGGFIALVVALIGTIAAFIFIIPKPPHG